MKRRNKEEMENMRGLVNSYLMSNNNDPHKAYNDYIKYFLLNNISLPYYVEGLKDFIKLSKDHKNNDVLKINDKINNEETCENSIKDLKDYLNNLTLEEVKNTYHKIKNDIKGTREYDILVFLYSSKANNNFNANELNYAEIYDLIGIFNYN